MKKHLIFLFLAIITALPAYAADATVLPNTPVATVDRSTAIAIEHEGNDSLGIELSMKLKERLNSSNLFKLEEKDTPKFRILISSAPEFEQRPSVGSAYAIVWVFSQSEATLRHFISREVGIVTPETLDSLIVKIIEKTDGLSVRYSYLFPPVSD